MQYCEYCKLVINHNIERIYICIISELKESKTERIQRCKSILSSLDVKEESRYEDIVKFLDTVKLDDYGTILESQSKLAVGYKRAIADIVTGFFYKDEEDNLYVQDFKERSRSFRKFNSSFGDKNDLHYVHVREDTDTDFRVAVRDFSDRYYVSQRSSIDSLPRALKDLAIQLAVTIHDGVKFRFKNDAVIFRRVDDKIIREDEDDKKVYKLEVDLKTGKLIFDTDIAEVDRVYSLWCKDGLANLRQAMAAPWLTPDSRVRSKMYVFLGDAAIGKSSWMENLMSVIPDNDYFTFSIEDMANDSSSSRSVAYDSVTRLAGFADENKGDSLKARKGWSNLMGLVTGRGSVQARKLYMDPVEGKAKAVLYSFSNFDFLNSYEEWDTRRIAGIKRLKDKEVEDYLVKTRKSDLYGPYLELYYSCNDWVKNNGKFEEVEAVRETKYSEMEIVLVKRLLNADWYWCHKDNNNPISIFDKKNRSLHKLTDRKDKTVNVKKLGLNTRKSKRLGGRVVSAWTPDLDSGQWHRTVKDLLDRDEIDRGLVDEFYSKHGLEWKEFD